MGIGTDWLVVVPTSGMSAVYLQFERSGRCLYATREEEAVAIATGLAIGGQRSTVLMQQAGVGNCLNAVLSLSDAYNVYFPILVVDRSTDDPNPVQRVSSRGTGRALDALGARLLDVASPTWSSDFAECVRRRDRWLVITVPGSP